MLSLQFPETIRAVITVPTLQILYLCPFSIVVFAKIFLFYPRNILNSETNEKDT